MSDHLASTHLRFLLFLCIIATLAVALRIYARRIQKIRLELNDYLIVLGLAVARAQASVYFVLDIETRSSPGLESVLLPNVISQTFWAIAVALIRSSIMLLYIRIFPARSFRYTCYAILTLNGTFSLGAVLTGWLICVPVACIWDFMVQCKSCGAQGLFNVLNATISLLLDITVVLLPTPVLWGLQTPVKKKVMLSGMFGLGIVICAITAKRLQLAATDQPAEKALFKPTSEVIGFLMCLEVLLGVTTACLPVLKSIFNRAHSSMKRFKSRQKTSASSIFGSIPIWIQLSQIWQSRSERRAGREDLDSIIEMEDWRRTQNCIQSTPRPVLAGGVKEAGIRVQREVHVESA